MSYITVLRVAVCIYGDERPTYHTRLQTSSFLFVCLFVVCCCFFCGMWGVGVQTAQRSQSFLSEFVEVYVIATLNRKTRQNLNVLKVGIRAYEVVSEN